MIKRLILLILIFLNLNYKSQIRSEFIPVKSKYHNTDTLIKLYIARGLNFIGKNQDSTLSYLYLAVKYSNKSNNTDLKGKAYFTYGTALYMSLNQTAAIYNLHIAESYFLEINNKRKLADVYNNLSSCYETFDFKKAVSYTYKSLYMSERIHDTANILKSKLHILSTYINFSEYKKASAICSYLRQNDYKYMDKFSKSLFLMHCARLNKQDSLDVGIYQLKAALALYNLDSLNELKTRHETIGAIFSLLSEFYVDKFAITQKSEDFKLARLQIMAAIKFNTKYSVKLPLYNLRCILAQLHFDNKNFDSSIYYLKMSDNYRHSTFYTKNAINYFNLLSESYAKLNRFDSAYRYSKMVNVLNDSLKTDEIKKKLLNLELEYELKKKDVENADKLFEKDRDITKRNLIISLISALTLLVIFAVIFYNQYKQKQKQKEFSLLLIKSQEDERLRVSRELHDSIGQSLLFLKMQSDSKYSKLIEPIIEELRQISRSLHPVKLETLTLQTLIINLVENAKSGSTIFFSYDIQDVLITDTSTKINIYRIIQEALSNIIKHSNAVNARVTLINESRRTIITITDDGYGFNISDTVSKQSIGLISMTERAKLIGAEIKIKSFTTGTKIELVLKHG